MDHTHLGLAALTPLHPSPSYSYIHQPSLPTTPSLLSRHPSRSSLSHLGTSKSHPNIASSSSSRSSVNANPTPAKATTYINARSTSNLPSRIPPRKRRPIRVPKNGAEDDWLTRTASALTLTRLEEKGQAWLAARESSTSLSALDFEDEGEDTVVSPQVGRSAYASARSSFTRIGNGGGRSRRGSNAGKSTTRLEDPNLIEGSELGKRGVEGGVVVPGFVDERELRELEALEGESEDGEEEEVDEREMRKVVMGRIGGWVDWAVGWMDVRGDGEVDQEADDGEGPNVSTEVGGLDVEEIRRRLHDRTLLENGLDDVEKIDLEGLPPLGEGGWAGDAQWLFGLARRIAL